MNFKRLRRWLCLSSGVAFLVWLCAPLVEPDERVVLPQAQRGYRGVVHVHSSASHDAEQSLDDIARSAQRGQLDFVVLTDHNSRAITAPEYRHDVLLIPGVELSTEHGHVLALGGDTSESKLDGTFSGLERLRKSGALLLGAHPDSAKHPIADDVLLQLDGFETLSSSTDFYRSLKESLGLSLLRFAVAPSSALASLYPAQSASLARFDRLSRERTLVQSCGVDDHGRTSRDERLQTYVTYLPTMLPERRAGEDAALVVERLRQGRSYCALGLYGDASAFSLTLRSAGMMGSLGDTALVPVTLVLRWNAPAVRDQNVVIYRDEQEWMRVPLQSMELELLDVGRYRVEVERTVPFSGVFRRSVRWIYTQPFYVEGQPG